MTDGVSLPSHTYLIWQIRPPTNSGIFPEGPRVAVYDGKLHSRPFPTSGLACRNKVYRRTCALLELCNKPASAHAHRHASLLFYEVRILNNIFQLRFDIVRQKWKAIFTQEPTLLSRIRFALNNSEATLESKIVTNWTPPSFEQTSAMGFSRQSYIIKQPKNNRFRHVSLPFYSCWGQFTLATHVFQFGAKNHRC